MINGTWYNIDVTEIKRREEEICRQDDVLENLIRASHDGFWSRNLVTNKVWYSPRYSELLGYGEGKLDSDSDIFADHLHADDRERVQ